MNNENKKNTKFLLTSMYLIQIGFTLLGLIEIKTINKIVINEIGDFPFFKKSLFDYLNFKYITIISLAFIVFTYTGQYFHRKTRLREFYYTRTKFYYIIALLIIMIGSLFYVSFFEKQIFQNLLLKSTAISFYLLTLWLLVIIVNMGFYSIDNEGSTKELSKKKIFKLFKSDNYPSKIHNALTWNTYDNKFVNLINSCRGILLIAVAGGGKSYSIIEPVYEQAIKQGQALFNYDVKFPDLTLAAYNIYIKNLETNPNDIRTFNIIYPNDIRYTNRCNPFDPSITTSQPLSKNAITSILLNINKSWVGKEGEFFSDSATLVAVAATWFLKIKHESTGKYISTLPHLIELVSFANNEMVLEIILENPECEGILASLRTAVGNGALEQLAGQISTVQTALSKLNQPDLYYVCSSNEIALDVNNFLHPSILNLGGNLSTLKAYAPVLSLIASTVKTVANVKDRMPMIFAVDEAATIFIEGLAELPNTGRGHLITTLIGLQNLSQLKEGYNDKIANVLTESFSNVIVGQVIGDVSADFAIKMLGEKKIAEKSKSISAEGSVSTSISSKDTKVINNEFLASLTKGEFVIKASDSEENILKTGSLNSLTYVTSLVVKKEKNTVDKLPYFNKDLIQLFKNNITINEKVIYLEYLKILEIIIKFKNEKTSDLGVKFHDSIKYYKKDEKFFFAIEEGSMTIIDELREKKQRQLNKKKISITATINKKIEEEILIESKKIEEEYTSRFNKIKSENPKETELNIYLYYYIANNINEKEEQKIMDRVLKENSERIKKETNEFIFDEWFNLKIKNYWYLFFKATHKTRNNNSDYFNVFEEQNDEDDEDSFSDLTSWLKEEFSKWEIEELEEAASQENENIENNWNEIEKLMLLNKDEKQTYFEQFFNKDSKQLDDYIKKLDANKYLFSALKKKYEILENESTGIVVYKELNVTLINFFMSIPHILILSAFNNSLAFLRNKKTVVDDW